MIQVNQVGSSETIFRESAQYEYKDEKLTKLPDAEDKVETGRNAFVNQDKDVKKEVKMSRVTYQEAETYISELPKFTKKIHWSTRRSFFFLGNPQNGKKVIHVAGTNGKGSVCVYLDAMLRAQGKAHRAFHISASDSDE